jgi:tRNA 2-selenouridine synthase
VKRLGIHDFLEQSAGKCIIDVRSEGEFLKGRIANAYNLPLFNNQERALVGTTYKQVGKEEAILQGLEIVGPKMADLVRQVKNINLQKEVYIYCWRGGMRSGSVGWLLQTAGYQVYLLEKGYKTYRSQVNNMLATLHMRLNVLSGTTGTGKTEILQMLVQQGEQVINLEMLARHKGSAFGALGQNPAPGQEDFDNQLFTLLQQMDPEKQVWIEDESRNIGSIYIPARLLELIKTSPIYLIHIPKEERIKRLVEEYSIHPKDELVNSLQKIRKRLGGQAFKECMLALEENNFTHFTELVLFYYDRTYLKHLHEKRPRIVKEVTVVNQNYKTVIQQLLE